MWLYLVCSVRKKRRFRLCISLGSITLIISILPGFVNHTLHLDNSIPCLNTAKISKGMLYLNIKSPKQWDGAVKREEPFFLLRPSSCGCHALGFQQPCILVVFGGFQMLGKRRQQARSTPRRCLAFGDLFFISYLKLLSIISSN